MMDQDADISGAKTRMPVQPIPDITREVLETYVDRESGFRSKKTFTVSPTLKACAEDELVKKEYKEMRCDIPGLTKSTFLMVFSPDGTKMASTHGNHNVYVTDLRTGKNIKTLVGHPRTPWCVAFHPSSNQILASGCLGGQVRIWDLSGGSEVWTAESQTVISSLAFHPVDRLLVIATYNELYFWDWSQPKPFMQTCTSNAKEKVRYVAFDRLGHKLITGIANTPQGFTRWERVRAPVPVARHSDRITAYRRRITPRIVTASQMSTTTTPPIPPENTTNNQNSIPERERRIATCYRNLVEQYEMLVHRYLEAYRPATTIDRGTDPMETEHLNNTDQPSTSAITINSPSTISITSTTSTPSVISLTETSSTSISTTSQTNSAPSQSDFQAQRNSPPCVPGPSGLSRFSRPNKRSNVPGSKSDSSTVYQSDSSSSSSSDESPTPKRRISLVPNSNLFRNKSEASVNKSTKDSTGTRKKLFISRPSAFHSTRNNSNVSNSSGNNRRVYDRFLPNPALSLDTRLSDLPEQRVRNPPEPVNNPQNSSSSNNRFDNLPLLLRGISEGTLSSADEVINFSERPIRDEPEAEPPENFTIQSPAEFANQATGIENMYGHILTDLETTLREARDFRIRRSEERRNVNRNVFLSFSERLENIMNQSDGILANLRRSVELLMDPSIQRQLQTDSRNTNPEGETSTSRQLPENTNQTVSTPTEIPSTPESPAPEPSTSNPQNTEPELSLSSENSRNKIYILRKPSGFHRQYSPRAGTSSRTNPTFHGGYQTSARLQRYFRIRQPRLNVRPHNSSSSVWRPFDDHSYPRDPEQTNNNNAANESQRSNVEPIRSLLTLSPRSPSTTPAEVEDNSESQAEQSDPDNPRVIQFRPDPRLVDPVTGNRGSEPPQDEIAEFGSDPITDHNYSGDPQTSIADHTYPRDPQSLSNNPPDYIAPLVSSLHSTITHISRQTNMLRRQVESIELIDRARFEVFQLQEMRRMWEDIRRHLSFVNSSTSERRSNLSNVRQMMAWTRISDPSPSSESAQSSTEQSTPEPSTERPTPSTSRSSASSSNESRAHPNQFLNRFRHAHIKKRMYWRRRAMKNENPHCNPRRYLRGQSYRDITSRSSRSDFPNRSDNWNLTEVSVTLMIRWLEDLLRQQTYLLETRDQPNPPDRTNMEYRIQSERIIQSRLRASRQRLNRASGQTPPNINLDDPVEFSSVRSRNEWIRYEARLRLSGYVETLSRFIESHNSIPSGLHEHLKIMLELAVLLTDLLLLQIMESIPYLSGSILDPERGRLSGRISQMCTNMLSNNNTVRLGSLIRLLLLRISRRATLPGPDQPNQEDRRPEPEDRRSDPEARQTDQPDRQIDQADRRIDQGDRHLDQGDRHLDQGDRRSDQGGRYIDQGVRQSDQGDLRNDPANRRSDLGNRRTDLGNRRTDLGCRRSDLGCRRSDLGDRRRIILGDRRCDPGDRRCDPGDRRSDLGDLRNDQGNRRSDLGDRRTEFGEYRAEFGEYRTELGLRRNEIEDLEDYRNDLVDRRGYLGYRRIDLGDRRNDIRDRRNDVRDRRCDLRDRRNDPRERRSEPVDRRPDQEGRRTESGRRSNQPDRRPDQYLGPSDSGRNVPRSNRVERNDIVVTNRLDQTGSNLDQTSRLLQSIHRSTVELNRSNVRDFNRHLRSLYQIRTILHDQDPEPSTSTSISLDTTLNPSLNLSDTSNTNTTSSNPGTSNMESSMAPVYRLTDLLSRLRSVRGRLEQVSQNFNLGRNQPGNSSSTTEHEPMRSTDESPSDDRESEPFEGFQSQWDQPLHDTSERLYRTQHINLYPPDPPSSSQSSPERNVQSGSARYWNVPTVQVNDVPVAEVIQNSPRIWLHRYPSDLRPLSAATGLFRPRFLIPLYAGVNPFDQDLDDSQREGPVGYDGIISTTVSPNHRIQMWDISKCNIPNISNHEKNIVVSECKIHNDGSVDISSDGTLLVTLLPSGGYLNVTNRLGIYSIKWDTLGQCLYTTSFEQNAISVSLSPLSRHLIVGLASRRVTLLPSDRWTMARIFLLDDRKIKIMGRGRLVVLRDLEQGRERDLNFMSVNCIKWMPVSGQGIVYATNTGQLKVLT